MVVLEQTTATLRFVTCHVYRSQAEVVPLTVELSSLSPQLFGSFNSCGISKFEWPERYAAKEPSAFGHVLANSNPVGPAIGSLG